MHDDVKSLGSELVAMLETAYKDEGRSIAFDTKALATYAAEEAKVLSLAISEPGFDQAIKAARDNLAMKAGLAAVVVGDRADARFYGILEGGLAIAARAIALL